FSHSTHPFINSFSYEKWNLAWVERIDFVYTEGGGALCSFHIKGCNSSCKRDVMIRRSLKTSRSCNNSEAIGTKVVTIITMMLEAIKTSINMYPLLIFNIAPRFTYGEYNFLFIIFRFKSDCSGFSNAAMVIKGNLSSGTIINARTVGNLSSKYRFIGSVKNGVISF